MARWDRARDALPERIEKPVLDLGCAFGFGTGKLAARHRVIGTDLSPEYVFRARREHPEIPFVVASAGALPFADRSFGAVVCLDVLEHVPEDEKAMSEIARVAEPGSVVVLSVPHAGPFAALDSLNLYQGLRRRFPRLPAPPEIGEGIHRHYSAARLLQLGDERIAPEREWQTGIGLAEIVHLPLLVVVRGLLRWKRLFGLLEYAYFAAYLLEDHLPVPGLGYHLMIRGRRM